MSLGQTAPVETVFHVNPLLMGQNLELFYKNFVEGIETAILMQL